MPEGAEGPGVPVEVDEEYDGAARLVVDGREIDVHARLSGHFEPISGRYHWSGRIAPSDTVAAALRPNSAALVRTACGHAADATVREQDPWGGFRITGTGRPPFAVPAEPVLTNQDEKASGTHV